ncbi:MAG: hypothetical protein LRY54_01675 [Alphaproteobacteria bacterium]|nr:hypothetical protein [Alphaproteobacteria bacterium]
MTAHRKFMDFSDGDPAIPLRRIARHAFARSLDALHQYQFNNPSTARDGDIMRRALMPVSDYFTARKLYEEGCTGVGFSSILMTGGGATEGFELVIRSLIREIRWENERRTRLSTYKPEEPPDAADDDPMSCFTRRAMERRNALFGKPPKLLKPAVVMPVPTYGYFLDTLKSWDVEPILVPRDLENGGRLDLKKIA